MINYDIVSLYWGNFEAKDPTNEREPVNGLARALE